MEILANSLFSVIFYRLEKHFKTRTKRLLAQNDANTNHNNNTYNHNDSSDN